MTGNRRSDDEDQPSLLALWVASGFGLAVGAAFVNIVIWRPMRRWLRV